MMHPKAGCLVWLNQVRLLNMSQFNGRLYGYLGTILFDREFSRIRIVCVTVDRKFAQSFDRPSGWQKPVVDIVLLPGFRTMMFVAFLSSIHFVGCIRIQSYAQQSAVAMYRQQYNSSMYENLISDIFGSSIRPMHATVCSNTLTITNT